MLFKVGPLAGVDALRAKTDLQAPSWWHVAHRLNLQVPALHGPSICHAARMSTGDAPQPVKLSLPLVCADGDPFFLFFGESVPSNSAN
jgi:hypothetical protein